MVTNQPSRSRRARSAFIARVFLPRIDQLIKGI
jgi:hypothetical protein